ncbi:hypothetical protein TTHERM_001353162 (macronuclear) [Tetrahymena thermophila SB210]|uniref:Uncharacterized protein n=1 Tax=Tetrahymena thermophila (strain SB210) TaxID=312017 RepID=W7XC56_TETTS|nr:hypothetical protein TTHERM_001353162 [Tetrahymena thermophila SB210]EWS74088.1 hypothetical protein TTHERM_001353162 [Tetrahymena thermophila SB210]|eukprot:XP_012653376.1 hypothetical protein TTHERM_001353162 [Tetrahymena thermophila SB210]
MNLILNRKLNLYTNQVIQNEGQLTKVEKQISKRQQFGSNSSLFELASLKFKIFFCLLIFLHDYYKQRNQQKSKLNKVDLRPYLAYFDNPALKFLQNQCDTLKFSIHKRLLMLFNLFSVRVTLQIF